MCGLAVLDLDAHDAFAHLVAIGDASRSNRR
jgi:hypothetical protein